MIMLLFFNIISAFIQYGIITVSFSSVWFQQIAFLIKWRKTLCVDNLFINQTQFNWSNKAFFVWWNKQVNRKPVED